MEQTFVDLATDEPAGLLVAYRSNARHLKKLTQRSIWLPLKKAMLHSSPGATGSSAGEVTAAFGEEADLFLLGEQDINKTMDNFIKKACRNTEITN